MSIMKLNSKRIDFEYTPGEEIFTFPEDTGLPFMFDVDEELTSDTAAMDAVGENLDEAEKLAEKGISGTVSNLGRITMPEECTPYIERFAAYMSKPDSQLCICSYQDEMIFGYCDGRRDHNVILQFVRILISNGLEVTITSNDYDNRESDHAVL